MDNLYEYDELDELGEVAKEQTKRVIRKQIENAVAKNTASAAAGGAAAGTATGAASSGTATAGATASGTAGGATAGGGAAVGGSSAAGIVGIIVGLVLLLLGRLKREASEVDPSSDEKTGGKVGGVFGFMFFLAIITAFLYPGNMVQNGSGESNIYPEDGVHYYEPEEPLEGEKQALFERLFEEYGIKENDIVECGNLYADSNEKNLAVCKEIVNYAIERCFSDDNGYIVDFIDTTLVERLMSAVQDLFWGDGREITRQSFFNARFPYCLNEYTVRDYLDGNIPEDELYDDLNYAEVISIVSLDENLNGRSFTFSEFYDIVCDPDMIRHFAEIDYSDVYFYVGRNTDLTFHTKEEAQAWIDEHIPPYIRKLLDLDGEPKEDNEENEENDPYAYIDPNDEINNWLIHCFVKIKVYPYGLVEMYDLVGLSYVAKCTNLPSLRNYEMMDTYEKSMRLLCDDYVELGTGYQDDRDSRSFVYDKAPTGRSAWCYIDESKLNVTDWTDWDLDNDDWGIEHEPTEDSVILDMDGWYICQLGNKHKRGKSGSTISQEGCIDCSYTMCAQYLLNDSVNINWVSENFVDGSGLFHSDTFLSEFGLARSSHSSTLSERTVRSAINRGMPVVVGIKGYWAYGGIKYHLSSSTHFFVIMG